MNKHLSRLDKVKIGTALLGCAFFTTASVLNPSARELDKKDIDPSLSHYPTIISVLPISLTDRVIKSLFKKHIFSIDSGYNLANSLSSILAFCLGSYAYKKLTQSNKSAVKKS